MSFLQLLEFTFRFSLSASDTATWIYVVITFICFTFGIGVIWGKLWNRDWGLAQHWGSAVMIIVFALFAAYAVLNLRSATRMEDWFAGQRSTVAHSITNSGSFNRSVFRSAWDKLYPLGGQGGLTSPVESGQELRLNNPDEAAILAAEAADLTRSKLRTKLPFLLGVPISTKNSLEVAAEACDAVNVDASRYPIIVPPNNEWVKTAATLQVNHAMDTGFNSLKSGLSDLKTAALWLLILSVAVPFVIVPMNALKDIQINPRP